MQPDSSTISLIEALERAEKATCPRRVHRAISVNCIVVASLFDLATLLKEMSSRQEYHFPIVAAQRQFRERYYGLSSAAMLEDLYLDAVAHYVSTHRPDSRLRRPPRGEKGWDYSFNDLKISHKVSKSGAPDIAVLWDATRTDLTHYTYGSPISLTTGGYSPNSIQLITGDQRVFKARPVERGQGVRSNTSLVLLKWAENDVGEVLHRWDTPSEGSVQEIFDFRSIWAEIAKASTRGIAANHLEVLIVSDCSEQVSMNAKVTLKSACRAGTFLIPKESLANVPVKTNNRAVLIDKKLIAALMEQAINQHLFIPMPVWFGAYAGDRPPDLYLAQKRNYDVVFSLGSD